MVLNITSFWNFKRKKRRKEAFLILEIVRRKQSSRLQNACNYSVYLQSFTFFLCPLLFLLSPMTHTSCVPFVIFFPSFLLQIRLCVVHRYLWWALRSGPGGSLPAAPRARLCYAALNVGTLFWVRMWVKFIRYVGICGC